MKKKLKELSASDSFPLVLSNSNYSQLSETSECVTSREKIQFFYLLYAYEFENINSFTICEKKAIYKYERGEKTSFNDCYKSASSNPFRND